jgi:hypothetical protein
MGTLPVQGTSSTVPLRISAGQTTHPLHGRFITVLLRLHRILAWMPVSDAPQAVAAAFLLQTPRTNPDSFTGKTAPRNMYVAYDSYASSIDSATATLAAAPNARDYNGAR